MVNQLINKTDVVVVGAGNAAMCAALAAREKGAEVVVLEKAPRKERGGEQRLYSRCDTVCLQRVRGYFASGRRSVGRRD